MDLMRLNALVYVVPKPISQDKVNWLDAVIGTAAANIREKVEGLVVLIAVLGEDSGNADLPPLTDLM